MSERPDLPADLTAWLRADHPTGTDLLATIAMIEDSDSEMPDAATIAGRLGLTRQKIVPVLKDFVGAGCLREVQPRPASKPTRYRLTPKGRRTMELALTCRKPFRPLRQVISDPLLTIKLVHTL